MAASTSAATILLPVLSSPRVGAVCRDGRDRVRTPAVVRRRSLLILPLSAAPFVLGLAPARAEDIGLFGLRKKLRTIEEAAEEVVREGERAVEKGIEAASTEIQAAEKQIGAAAATELEAAEKEIGAAAAGAATGLELGLGGDLAQAGAVAAAEVVGVLAAVSVVNGILGPEGRSS